MSLETVNGHVLIANQPDWSAAVNWRRLWETAVTRGETGAESRTGLRSVPLNRLEFTVFTESLAVSAKLDDRILAARKSGKVCVPVWGRGGLITAAAAAVVTLLSGAWSWQAGDYLLLQDGNGGFEIGQVSAVDGLALTLESELENEYGAGCFVWPLLFGKLETGDESAVTTHHGQMRLTVNELVSSRSATIGGAEAEVVDPWIFN